MELPQLVVLLSSYRTGELTLAEPIAQLERLLMERPTAVAPLVAALEAEHARAPFAPNTFRVCSDEYVEAAPVGSFAANAYGLHDLFGNVFEWLEDCSLESPTASSKSECIEHELRGGSWFTEPQFVRTSYRNGFGADHRSTSVGFRVVREIQP